MIKKYVGCQSNDVTITLGMIMVFANISFFLQFHTITTDPIQPLTIISGFLGWNFTAHGVRGWPISVYEIYPKWNSNIHGGYDPFQNQQSSRYDHHALKQIYDYFINDKKHSPIFLKLDCDCTLHSIRIHELNWLFCKLQRYKHNKTNNFLHRLRFSINIE